MSQVRHRVIRAGIAVAGVAAVVTLSGCVIAPAYPPAGVYVRPAPVYVTPYPRYHYHYHPRHHYRRW